MERPRLDRVLLVVLGISLGANLVQHGIPEWITEKFGPPPTPAPPSVLVGQSVTPTAVRSAAGDAIQLTFDRPTVLYVISPTCVWCKANTPVINALAAARHDNYTFVGLSITGDGLGQYLKEHPLPFPVYVIPNPFDEVWKSYGLGPTPYTVAIEPGGKILGAWAGALAVHNRAAAEQFFGLKLPTLGPQS